MSTIFKIKVLIEGKMKKQRREVYVAPVLEVVRFQMESGYAESAFVSITDFDEGLFS